MKRGSLSTRLIVGAVLVLVAVAAADALRPHAAAEPLPAPPKTASTPKVQHPGGRAAIERLGAEWARRFAANGLDDCYRTGPELCERTHCVDGGASERPTCKPVTPAYRRSFRTAVVDRVVIKQYEALARLSNGELIRLEADAGRWWVLALGREIGRGFFEKPG